MPVRANESQLSDYFHRRGRRLGMPIAGNFELTSRCNFNCPMCYVHQTEEQIARSGKRELTAAQWLDIARQARDRGMIFALLTGGEPLMRKDFFEIYDGMKKLGLVISINSNGSMLRGPILERFLKNPPSRFNISLYGGCEETYRRMCGQSVYGQVKENIRALRAAGVDVNLNVSVTPYNCKDLEQIYADAEALDVTVSAAFYMYPPIRVKEDAYGCGDRLSPEEAARCSVKWDTLRFTTEEMLLRGEKMERLAGLEPEGCPLEEGPGVRCRAGSSSFWLTWDGKMLPCGMMAEPVAYPLEAGFDAAWDQIRDRTAEIRTPASCEGCSYKDLCGVCAAVAYTETGRYDGTPEYLCEKARHTLRFTREACAERKRT